MPADPKDNKTLWQELLPLNILGLAIGTIAYFIRLQFNISLWTKFATIEDTTFSWTELIFVYILPALAVLNFFGWFGYLQKNIGRNKD